MQSGIATLDWDDKGEILAINSAFQEIFFIDVKDKKVISAATVKSTKWSTWTSKFGFETQGIFKDGNYSSFMSVDRSNS